MFEVSVEAVFSASHRLRLPDGSWEPPHGHDWQVTATFAGEKLDRYGMLVDFTVAEAKLREVVRRLHHTDLNHCPVMKDLNPSAEHVAKVVYHQIAENSVLRDSLHRVRVTEAPGCAATYIGGAGAVERVIPPRAD